MSKFIDKHNCMFCKYKNSIDECVNAIQNGYECKSISNMLWCIPVIKHITSFIHHIKWEIDFKKSEKEYKRLSDMGYDTNVETDTMKFIWGIKAYDDLSSCKCGLNTMNDIDIIYLKDEKKYILGIETMLSFDTKEAKKNYTKRLLDGFTKYMDVNGLNKNSNISWYSIFNGDFSISNKFDSIEDCYAAFKFFVNGYLNS